MFRKSRKLLPPPAGTVTLRIQSPGALAVNNDMGASNVSTKTYLEDDTRVLWEEGDDVYINGTQYPVVPDTDNPAFATVPDVVENDFYVAAYTAYEGGFVQLEDGTLVVMTLAYQQYRENSFGKYSNAMVAYSESTELQFYNLSGVLKLPVKGNGERLKKVYVTGNNGEWLSGYMAVDLPSLAEGRPEISLQPDLYPSLAFKTITVDCGEEGLELSSEPTYIYVAMPPAAYSAGISVTMETVDGKVARQTTGNEVVIERAVVKQMADIQFVPNKELEFALGEVTATSLAWSLSGQKDRQIKTMAVYKDLWNIYIEANPTFPAGEIAKYLLGYTDEVYMLDGTGEFSTEAKAAYGNSGFVGMAAETDYMILSAYVDGENIVGAIVNEARTAAASGEPPVLIVTPVQAGELEAFKTAIFNIKAENASGIRTYIFNKEWYDNMKNGTEGTAPMTDEEIIATYGVEFLPEELAEALSPSGHDRYFGGLIENTDYVLLVLATAEEGMSVIEKADHRTAAYLPEGSTWELVTESAKLRLGVLGADLVPVTVYRNSAADIFKVDGLWAGFEDGTSIGGTLQLNMKDDAQMIIDARDRNMVKVENNMSYSGLGYIQEPYLYPMNFVSKSLMTTENSVYGTYDETAGIIDCGTIILSCALGHIDADENTVLYLNPEGPVEPVGPSMSIESFRPSGEVIEW